MKKQIKSTWTQKKKAVFKKVYCQFSSHVAKYKTCEIKPKDNSVFFHGQVSVI